MFGKLKRLRKERGLTCQDMAERIGLETKAAYSKKECGRTKFTLNEARIVSEILGCSIDDIFFESEVSLHDTSDE